MPRGMNRELSLVRDWSETGWANVTFFWLKRANGQSLSSVLSYLSLQSKRGKSSDEDPVRINISTSNMALKQQHKTR